MINFFPPHRVYVEPFGGAASVLLRKSRCQCEIYNDIDDEVVNLFRVLQHPEQGGSLVDKLRLTPFARREFNLAYEVSDDPVERARRTVIKSFMGFGSNAVHRRSGFRGNGIRAGTLPQHDWSNYPLALSVIIERMAGVVVESKDAIDLMAVHDGPETLHYVDPPYVMETRGDASADYRAELTNEGHDRLLASLSDLEGMVVLSGYAHPLYDLALADWWRHEKRAVADGARERTEVIWLNPACSRALREGVAPSLFGDAA